MDKFEKGCVVLSMDEYNKLTNPDERYTRVTETVANNLVNKLLKDYDEVCWNDTDEDYDDGCCTSCCIYVLLGGEAADRICTRYKRWSK